MVQEKDEVTDPSVRTSRGRGIQRLALKRGKICYQLTEGKRRMHVT